MKKILLLIFTFGVSAHAQTAAENLQWSYCALTPSATDVSLDTRTDTVGQNSWVGEAFPFTVPAGKALGITRMAISQKMTVGRASYFVVDNVASVPSTTGEMTFDPPFVIPGGSVLHAHAINNSLEDQQWICVRMQGKLIDAPAGGNYRTYFAGLK
jgi:hypothetical protein